MTIWEVEKSLEVFYGPLRQKLMEDNHKPQLVKRVDVSKPNRDKRKLWAPLYPRSCGVTSEQTSLDPIIFPPIFSLRSISKDYPLFMRFYVQVETIQVRLTPIADDLTVSSKCRTAKNGVLLTAAIFGFMAFLFLEVMV